MQLFAGNSGECWQVVTARKDQDQHSREDSFTSINSGARILAERLCPTVIPLPWMNMLREHVSATRYHQHYWNA